MSAPLLEKVPPQSLEAEQATLGAMLMEREAIARVVDILDPEDFYHPQHQMVYRAMIDLFNDSDPVDLITLQARLQDRDQLQEIGGTPYLAALQETASTAAAISHYAKIVREKSILRALIRAGDGIRSLAHSAADEDVETVVDRCEQEVFAVGERTITAAFTPIRDLLGETYDRIDEMQESHRPGTGLLTGYDDLDSYLSGLQPSDLVVFAARPSMGKTALALNIACYVAKTQNKTLAVFSLEMAKEQLALRLLCSEAGVNQQSVRQGYIDRGDMDRIAIAASELYKAPVYLDDTATMSVLQIRGKARRLRAEHGLDLIIVDYIQLVSGYGRFENRNQEISQVARSLKALARELRVPVLALSQLSRAVEARGHPRRPLLSDLRESGSIEQEADVVAFIYRPMYYGPEELRAAGYLETDRNLAEIIIAKQRNGPTGIVRLAWIDEFVRFENLEERFAEPEGE
ncbi:MAG: replicative DNA helicase [Armatimonadota bacterium]|nr:replicative DNA helicase [Armatimonadota bacterium]